MIECIGSILLDGQPTQEFSQADIHAGKVIYKHQAKHKLPDCFLLSLTRAREQTRFCVYVSEASVTYTSYTIENAAITDVTSDTIQGVPVPDASLGGRYVVTEHTQGVRYDSNPHRQFVTANVPAGGGRYDFVPDATQAGGRYGPDVTQEGRYDISAHVEYLPAEVTQQYNEEQNLDDLARQPQERAAERDDDSEEERREDSTGSWYTWAESTRAVMGGYSNDFLQQAASDQMVTMVTMPPTQVLGLMVSGIEPLGLLKHVKDNL